MSNIAKLNIPISFNQIIDLIKQLPKTQQKQLIELLQDETTFTVPQWQQEIVVERMKTANDESFLPWNKAKKQLKHKK